MIETPDLGLGSEDWNQAKYLIKCFINGVWAEKVWCKEIKLHSRSQDTRHLMLRAVI